MKLKTEDDVRVPTSVRPARGRCAVLLMALAAAAGPLLPLDAAIIDNMCPPVKFQVGGGGMDYLEADLVDCQLVFSGQFPGPTLPNDTLGNYDSIYWPTSLPTVSLLNRTLEVRMDLVQVSGDDVFLVLGVDGPSGGYELAIDRNELVLGKFHGSGTTVFAWNTVPLINQNVTVVLSLTRTTNNVELAARIVDRTNHERILYEIRFTDGPGPDPVIPTPPKGLTFFTAPDPGPPLDSFSLAWVGVWQYAATSPPPVEVVVDNFEYDVYDAPVLGSEWPCVLLPWSANTAEEQIVVVAGSLASDAVWTPWPEPIFKRFGEPCLAVPTTSARQFFKLVPGSQFMDDFDPLKQPFASRNLWVQYYWESANANKFTWNTDSGSLRVQCPNSTGSGQVVVMPPGPDVLVRDFYASVDILDWGTGSTQRSVGIAARGFINRDVPTSSSGYIGELWLNYGSVGKAHLNIFSNGDNHGPQFDLEAGVKYRLVFTGTGSQLTLRLFRQDNMELAAAPWSLTGSLFSSGPVGLWVGNYGNAACDFTLDNFFVTGTKP